MSEKLNQHYVPQFYFRNFSANRKTIATLLVKNGKVIEEASIKGQCSKNNFYGSQELEEAFSKMELDYSKGILAALEVANSPDAEFSSFTEWDCLFEAIIFQRARAAVEIGKHAPLHEEAMLQFFKMDLENGDDFEGRERMIQEINSGNISFTENSQYTICSNIELMLAHAQLITDLSLCLIRNRTDYPFIFSDAPVVFYNTYCKHVKNRGVIGLQCPGLQVFYPITPWTCIMLYDSQKYGGSFTADMRYDACQRSDISQINALQLHHSLNTVYFGDPIHQEYIEALWGTHRSGLSTPRSEFRVNLDLWVDGKPPEEELFQIKEPQLDCDFNLSFMECDPISETDYVYSPRSPELREQVRMLIEQDE